MNVRFGAFEVDLEGRRLLKRGMPIALREQSFQVLASLMERPGEIVTREDLRKRLWPSNTFVDFEVALNSAVSRLRDALGDSADSPSFIETIPKRGYRFVVPIPKRPAVAVMPFVNQTADPQDEYFGDGLTEELIRVLSRVEGLRVTAPSVVFGFKGQPCDTRRVGRELSVEAVLEGSVWRSGDRIRVTVNLVGVKDGFNLWAHRFEGNLGDLFRIQDEVCAGYRSAACPSGNWGSPKSPKERHSVRTLLEGMAHDEEAKAARRSARLRLLSGGNSTRARLPRAVSRCGHVLHRERGLRILASPIGPSAGRRSDREGPGSRCKFSHASRHPGNRAHVSMALGGLGTCAPARYESGA